MPVESTGFDIEAIMEEVKTNAGALLKEIADMVAEQARGRCPYDDAKQPTKENPNPVHLRDTIAASEEAGDLEDGSWGVQVIAGDLEEGITYAPFVELGTYKMAAQPYLGPSYEEGRSELEGRLSEIIP